MQGKAICELLPMVDLNMLVQRIIWLDRMQQKHTDILFLKIWLTFPVFLFVTEW